MPFHFGRRRQCLVARIPSRQSFVPRATARSSPNPIIIIIIIIINDDDIIDKNRSRDRSLATIEHALEPWVNPRRISTPASRA